MTVSQHALRELTDETQPHLFLCTAPGTRLDVSDAWCEVLFASWLQPSDAPTAETVAEAITFAMRQFGIRGCAGRMAQEFGDHPEAAAERMRWVRRLAADTRSAAA